MISKTANTVRIEIHVAGDPSRIRDLCQKWCEKGLCVSITPTSYSYKFGCERGAIVGMINYPRFPKTEEQLCDEAKRLALYLMNSLSQGSCSVVTDKETIWFSRREQDNV
jgi:hypothetical protein